jgi:uncharacterized membrane protein (TIGR02234 family)
MRRANVAFLLALLLELIGSGGALLVSLRTWQTITTRQPGRTDVLHLNGRAIDSSSTALGLVALAGIVAVLATRGVWRRVVGFVVALAGVGLVWRAIASAGAVGVTRARSLVESHHKTVSAAGVVPHVSTHGLWPVLSLIGGVLVLGAGALITACGQQWQGMSSRYEAPAPDAAQEQTRAATALWTALDRGEDPTD